MRHLLPAFILENVAANQYRGSFAAATLFVDLTGYTTFTESLMQHGQTGAEIIGELMRDLFRPLIQSIFAHNGFIAQAAGDAFTAIFPVSRFASAALAQQAALAAAVAIQEQMQAHTRQDTPLGPFDLTVKVGMGFGTVEWGILESVDATRRTYYVKGSAVQQCTRAELFALGGDIILSAEVLAQLEPMRLSWRPLPEGYGQLQKWPSLSVEKYAAAPHTLSPTDLTICHTFFPADLFTNPLDGEFRQVFNLFIGLPDEPDHDELAAFLAVIFRLQEKYGGYLESVAFDDKGCNALLLWGAPVSHETDLVRALNFTLELQEIITLRAALSYRLARAGYLGAELWQSYTCYGRGANLAARFMVAAAWGEIWLDEEVARRAAPHFALSPMGLYPLKGFNSPQPAYRLEGRHPLPRSQQAPPLAMIGREAELAALQNFVSPIFQGQFAGLLAIVGEAGLGKSRLADALAQQLTQPAAASIFLCQADEIIRASLNPFRYWLRRHFAQVAADVETDNKRRFAERLDQLIEQTPDQSLRRELDRTRSVLGALLDLRWPGSLYEQLEPELRLENQITALVTLLRAESLARPVLLQLEDMHWFDPESVQFLRRLSRAATGFPMAMVGTSREPVPDDWLDAAAPRYTLDLSTLSDNAIHALVHEVTGHAPVPALVAWLAERGQGNPFFIEQILRYSQENGHLQPTPDGLALVGREVGLPTDVQAILIARLDRLSQEVRHVVQTAAILGREFETQVLSHILQAEQFHLPIHPFIVEAERQAIWSLLAEWRYLFRHTLLRDTAYQMQLLSRRQMLHALALTALETTYAADLSPHLAVLAYHAEQSQNQEKQRLYYAQAGEAAAAAFQNQAAVSYFTRLLPLLTDPAEQVQSRLKLGEVWLLMGRWEDAGRLFQEGLALAEQAGDPLAVARCQQALGDLTRRRGHFNQALTWLQQAQAAWEKHDHPAELSQTQVDIGTVYWRQGDYAAAQQLLQQGLVLAQANDNWRTASLALSTLGNVAYVSGDLPYARRLYEESLALRRTHHDDVGIAGILNNLGVVASAEGDYAQARRLHEESLAIKRAKGDMRAMASSLMNLSIAAANLGDETEAWQLCAESLTLRREIGDRQGVAICLNNLGILAVARGEEAAAQRHHEESLALAQAMGNKPTIADAYTGLGVVAMQKGEYAAAVHHYQQSLTLYQALGEKRGISTVRHDQGILAWQQRDMPLARQMFQESLTLRQEMEDQTGALSNLIGLAAVLADSIETQREACHLWGAVEASLARQYVWLDGPTRRLLAWVRDRLAVRMGEDGFAAAYGTGQEMAWPDVLRKIERAKE